MNWLTFVLLMPAVLIVLGVLALVFEIKTSSGDARPLRKDIKERFYPLLERLGYRRRSTSLSTTFRRVVGDRVRIVQLNWDKYHQPSFAIAFGETPNSVIPSPLGDVTPEAVEPCHSEALGALQRKPRRSVWDAWFKLRKPLFEALTTMRLKYAPHEVVDQLLMTYPEIERWFEAREVGPHIRMLRNEVQPGVPANGPYPAGSARG
jgi:hypothetical protein